MAANLARLQRSTMSEIEAVDASVKQSKQFLAHRLRVVFEWRSDRVACPQQAADQYPRRQQVTNQSLLASEFIRDGAFGMSGSVLNSAVDTERCEIEGVAVGKQHIGLEGRVALVGHRGLEE